MNEQPNELLHLERYIVNPIEDLDAEYKGWLDLGKESNRATLAKAVIALANHGGGVIVLGFEDLPTGLAPIPKPTDISHVTQDDINSAIHRYAEPQLHCSLHMVKHPESSSIFPVIRVPGGDVPVMSKRDQTEGGLGQHKAYVRKPGPRSEEPQTAEEWRTLLDRCVRTRREGLLESIRGIVLGQVRASEPSGTSDALEEFMDLSRDRWLDVVKGGPVDAPYRFPYGRYEFAMALTNAQPTVSLTELKNKLAVAQRIRTSGWPPFLDIGVEGLNPYPFSDCIEAWLGRPLPNNIYNDSAHADFWRASLSGQLYIIRGYGEDVVDGASSSQRNPGKTLAIDISVIRIWEQLRVASEFSRTFANAQEIAVKCLYTGLLDRMLLSSLSPAFPIRRGTSKVNEVMLTGQFTPQQIEDNAPEALQNLMAPLFEHFDFFKLTSAHVQKIIERYRQSWPW